MLRDRRRYRCRCRNFVRMVPAHRSPARLGPQTGPVLLPGLDPHLYDLLVSYLLAFFIVITAVYDSALFPALFFFPFYNGIAHYSLCEACVVHCESCAGLSLCRFCKSEHLRSCDINIWTRTTLEIADEEIEQKTTEIDAIHHSIHELQRQLSRAEEALNYAYELKMEAEEIVASLEQQERKSAIDVEEITTSLVSAMDV